MSRNRYVLIIGCGQLGVQLADKLSLEGDSVVVIDKDTGAMNNLSSDFSGFRIEGDATRISILKEARIDKADVVIAISSSDNINMMVSQIARTIFGVKSVLARIYDQNLQVLCEKAGIINICTTRIAADLFLKALEDKIITDREKL